MLSHRVSLAVTGTRGLGAALAAVTLAGACGSLGGAGSPTVTPTAAAEGEWVAAADLPVAVTEVAGAVLDGRLYVAGGIVPGGAPGTSESTARAFVYDPAADTWAEIAPLPEPRDHLGVAALDGEVYASGGAQTFGGRSFDTLYAYDPSLDTWAERARMPGARYAHAIVALDDRLYVAGGVATRAEVRQEVWVYDPGADSWTVAGARLPTWREHVAGVAHDGRFLLVGGRDGANLAAVEAYDPREDAWQALPPMPTPKGALTVAVLDGQLHTTGGEEFTTNRTIATHEALNLSTGTWRRLPDLPSPRHGLASGVVDDRWIVVGGGPSPGATFSDVVEIYEP